MIEVKAFSGTQIEPYLDAVAALRIVVFRDWPYLYDGDRSYEANYLATYSRSPQSLFVLAFDGERVIGASTGIPLADESDNFRKPFLKRDIAEHDVFYFGESVLLREYRGRGLGHRFFDERENYALTGGFHLTAFCAVERDAHDARRPENYVPNDAFWRKRGYRRQDDMFCAIEWREVDAASACTHALRFWLRPLEQGGVRPDHD